MIRTFTYTAEEIMYNTVTFTCNVNIVRDEEEKSFQTD